MITLITPRHLARVAWAMVLAMITLAASPASLCSQTPQGQAPAPEAIVKINAEAGADLVWPDRRPMGRIFLSRVTSGWETNPRGFLNTPDVDITTEAGLEQFGEDLMAYADRCIEILKARNCQGVIIWDLEGQEMPHAISYIGDPRVLPEIAPEMDRFADAFIQRFQDAGLHVGLTIRPTYAEHQPDKRWAWQQVKVTDAVAEMSKKIAYARERWGVSIYYLDSNVGRQVEGDVPWILPTEWMADLAGRHPGVLIIPEWEALGYYQHMAPYKDWWDGHQTPPKAREQFEGAFSFIVPKPNEVATHWHDIVTAVAAGDVLFVDAWYHSIPNELVSHVYEAAEFYKAGPPAEVQQAQGEQLIKLARSAEDWRVRLAASEKLVGRGKATLELWQSGLNADHWQIRRAAVQGIGRVKSEEAARVLLPLLNDRGPLQSFAVVSLGYIGEDAVPVLLEQAKQGNVAAIGALSANTSPEALNALRELATDESLKTNALVRVLRGMEGRVDDAVVTVVAKYVLHDNPQVARSAVDLLGEHPTQRSLIWLERAATEAKGLAKRRAENQVNRPVFKKLKGE